MKHHGQITSEIISIERFITTPRRRFNNRNRSSVPEVLQVVAPRCLIGSYKGSIYRLVPKILATHEELLHLGEATVLILVQVAAQRIAAHAAQLADGAMGQVLALEVKGFEFTLHPRVRMGKALMFQKLNVRKGELHLHHNNAA